MKLWSLEGWPFSFCAIATTKRAAWKKIEAHIIEQHGDRGHRLFLHNHDVTDVKVVPSGVTAFEQRLRP